MVINTESPFVSDSPRRVHVLYATALRWFEDVARGVLALPASSPPGSRTAVDDGPRYVGGGRAFTAEQLDGL